ncbi:MAG TPA: GH25 family lysozyme [Clostridiales bacterium]|nr:GH25 family lysozyme [Clostridiales bacterium]
MKLKLQPLLFTILWTVLLLFGVSAAAFAGQERQENTAGADYSKILAVSANGLTFHSKYTNATYNIPSNVKALGVDVSFWQGSIDWQQVKADGIDFAMIRAAGRDSATGVITTDSWFERNIKGAQAAGLKVGVYIFSQAITVQEAEEEADYMLRLLAPYDLDLPVVIDYEFRSGHTGRLAEANLTKTMATNNVLAFCNYVSSRGYIPMLYANTDMLNNYLNKDDILANVDLWYARYGDTPYITGFALWQYSNSGKVNGVSGNVDCNFSFVDLDELGIPFDDVTQGKWYFEAVLYAYHNDLFDGVSTHAFAPDAAMNRGMLATVLYRLEGSPAVGGETAFTDVKAGSWYEKGVRWAEQNGIVNGVSANLFSPNTDLTREQIAAMLYRYSQYKEYDVRDSDSLAKYTDGNSVSSYAVTGMKWAVGSGYLRGVTAQTLCPKESASRAQVATILMRFCEDHTEIE